MAASDSPRRPMAGIDLTTITAISSWALAAGTVIILYWQTRQNQKLNSANAVMELRERFDSSRMRRARKHLSSLLVTNAHNDVTNVEVATFFELVGALTHRKLLDQELVWEAFGGWISSYWYGVRHPIDLIGNARAELKDPLIFHEFEWLYGRVLAIDKHRLGAYHSHQLDSAEESRVMLQRESNIETDVS